MLKLKKHLGTDLLYMYSACIPLCCKLETNITLYGNYTSIKKNKLNK